MCIRDRICPGLMVSAATLVTKAAQLSKVEFLPPTRVIAQDL